MPKRHVASDGESIESIAFENGFFWETVWNADENAPLRELRSDPNILVEGDEVVVPEKRQRSVQVATGKKHVFKLRGVPSILRVQLVDGGKPRAGLAFTVEANGRKQTGTTDGEGWVKCYLMPDVESGELRLDASGERFAFQVGKVSPPDTPRGVQTRLRNLGYYSGEIESSLSDEAVEALHAFQRDRNLPETDDPDDATRDALVEAHGS